MDINPILYKPVTRAVLHNSLYPLTIVDPSTCVDLVHGTLDNIIETALTLVHGANYNDPAPFESPGAEQVMRSAFTQRSF
jgi:cyanobactin biosynthesis protein (PatB/AcyB/McaB family)